VRRLIGYNFLCGYGDVDVVTESVPVKKVMGGEARCRVEMVRGLNIFSYESAQAHALSS
jgi:hypothetical protein